MEKLTVLMFSKNDIKNAIGLVKHLYGVADEFVLIDSSNKENRKFLADQKKKRHFDKLKIFTTVALGYPDPLRMYGLSKCKGKWVILLDTDERLSPKLRSSIRALITDSKCDAFALRRYERANKDLKFFTLQVRLYKKDKVTYKGIRHEQANVKGTTEKLEGKEYYIEHHEEVSIHTGTESGKLDVYEERLTYNLYNKRFIEYLGKLTRPKGNVEDTKAAKYVRSMLKLYQMLGFKKSDQEISNLDYFMFKVLMDVGYTITGRGTTESIRNIVKDRYGDVKKMRAWKKSPDGEEALGISKIINSVGITKFLKLDEDRTIKKLNREYKDKYEGINLLLKLLAEEYRKTHKRDGG